MTDTSTTLTTAAGSSGDTPHEQSVEKLVAGRLTLQVTRNQLDSQAAGLRSQLAITEEHRRHAERLLARLDEKLAKEAPDVYASLVTDVEVEVLRPSRSTGRRTSS